MGVGKFSRFSKLLFFIVDYNSISKFLNRILGMEVALQNALFKYFSTTLAAIILEAKRSGRWDMGILGKFLPLKLHDSRQQNCVCKIEKKKKSQFKLYYVKIRRLIIWLYSVWKSQQSFLNHILGVEVVLRHAVLYNVFLHDSSCHYAGDQEVIRRRDKVSI